MNYEQVFAITNGAALAGWVLLVFFPRASYTRCLVGYGLLPAALSVLYVFSVLIGFKAFGEGSFGSLAGVRALFTNDILLLAGWVHYLAFDLLVGGWIVRDSQRLGFSHWQIVPSLIMTFLLGPIGFFVYWLMRTMRQRGLQPLHGKDGM